MNNILGFVFMIVMGLISVRVLDGDATVCVMAFFIAACEVADFCEKVKAVERRKRARR